MTSETHAPVSRKRALQRCLSFWGVSREHLSSVVFAFDEALRLVDISILRSCVEYRCMYHSIVETSCIDSYIHMYIRKVLIHQWICRYFTTYICWSVPYTYCVHTVRVYVHGTHKFINWCIGTYRCFKDDKVELCVDGLKTYFVPIRSIVLDILIDVKVSS